MDSTQRLQKARQRSPDAAGQRGGCEADGNEKGRRQVQGASRHRGRERAPDELSLCADVEDADGERNRNGEAGEDEDASLHGALPERRCASERSVEEMRESERRVLARGEDGDERHREGNGNRDHRAP